MIVLQFNKINKNREKKMEQVKGVFLFYLKFQACIESHPLVQQGVNKKDLTSFCESKNLSAPYLRSKTDLQNIAFAWSPSAFHSLNNVKSFGRSNFEILFPNGTTMSQLVIIPV